MSESIIDRLYAEHVALTQYLGKNAEPSFGQMVDDDFRKLLALSVASLFEHVLTDAILNFCKIKASGDPALFCFVRMKAVERQYATYFDWNGKTANTFFKLFGEPLGTSMKDEIRKNSDLKAGCEAFLELGYLRNCLVHQNFASFAFDKTAQEVSEEYRSAMKFTDYVVGRLCGSEATALHDKSQPTEGT
jgi:hypothetical protein